MQGNKVQHNVSAGVIISNQTLVLQKLTRKQAGNYTCIGSNTEGDGESQSLDLLIRCETGYVEIFFVI